MQNSTAELGERSKTELLNRLLEVIEREIVPLTREGVRMGNKVFGAALLKKSDLSTILTATNLETENPLWHGEMSVIKGYYEMVNSDKEKRVDPGKQIFLSTHEPCTMCMSAIAWAGYDNYFYLFSHEDSRDSFTIGHDLKILSEVFKHEPGGYAKSNSYWSAFSIVDLVKECDAECRHEFEKRISAIRSVYSEMSEMYQAAKNDSENICLK